MTQTETDTTTLFINEASHGPAGELEKLLGNVDGVRAVELGPPDQHAGEGPLMLKRATITYDTTATGPQALREHLEALGYTVTTLADVGE